MDLSKTDWKSLERTTSDGEERAVQIFINECRLDGFFPDATKRVNGVHGNHAIVVIPRSGPAKMDSEIRSRPGSRFNSMGILHKERTWWRGSGRMTGRRGKNKKNTRESSSFQSARVVYTVSMYVLADFLDFDISPYLGFNMGPVATLPAAGNLEYAGQAKAHGGWDLHQPWFGQWSLCDHGKLLQVLSRAISGQMDRQGQDGGGWQLRGGSGIDIPPSTPQRDCCPGRAGLDQCCWKVPCATTRNAVRNWTPVRIGFPIQAW
jgi:hypothetical protein